MPSGIDLKFDEGDFLQVKKEVFKFGSGTTRIEHPLLPYKLFSRRVVSADKQNDFLAPIHSLFTKLKANSPNGLWLPETETYYLWTRYRCCPATSRVRL